MEEDGEFVYLALERCKHSLADVLGVDSPSEHLFVDSQAYPTPLCMQVFHLPVCLSVCLSVCPSVCLSVCPYVCLPACLSVCGVPVCDVSVCLPACLAVYLSVCLISCASVLV